MTGLDIFAWIVLIVLILTALFGFIFLAMLPGKIAAERGHPQADAINIAGWVGALTLGVFWPLALIWAYTRSPFQLETTAEAKPEPATQAGGTS